MKNIFIVILILISFSVNAENFKFGVIEPTSQMLQFIPKVEIPKYSSLDMSSQLEVDHSDMLPPVKSQGSQGSCVGWATGYYLKTYQEKKEHGSSWNVSSTDYQCSPAFVYNHINWGNDGGAYHFAAYEFLCKMGCASWSDMPYTDNNYTNWPSADVYENAMSQRAQSCATFYYGTASNNVLQAMKNWLSSGHCFTVSINVYSNFTSWYFKGENDVYSSVSGNLLGGHAMCVVGYSSSRHAFKFVNSWGTAWGYHGFTWIHENLFKSGVVRAAYKLVDKINYHPQAIAKINFQHSNRGKLKISINNNSWSKMFLNYDGGFNQINEIAFDITDGANSSNNWKLTIQNDSYFTGNLTSGTITYNLKTQTIKDLPQNVNGSSTKIYSFTTNGTITTVERVKIALRIAKDKDNNNFDQTNDILNEYFGE